MTTLRSLLGACGCAAALIAAHDALAVPYHVSCARPDDSFASFLQKFSADRSFQQMRITYPLVIRSTAEGYGSLQVLEQSTVAALKAPVYSTAEQKQKGRLRTEFPVNTANYVEVFEYLPDTDVTLLTYEFRKQGNCWYLEGVIDGSH